MRIEIGVLEGHPKVVYVLYAPGYLRPLDRMGEVLRLVFRVDVPSDQNRLSEEQLVASWVEHVAQEDKEVVVFPERIQAALPMWEWHHKNEFGAKVTQELDPMVLLFKYPERSTRPRLRDAVLRFADLPFYASWRLLEYAGLDERGHLCRSYALCQERQDGATLLPLDGSSGPIHSANALPHELRLDTAEQRAAYLRFFCWAIESSEGPFLLPRHRWELDLTDRLGEKVLDHLKPTMAIEELGEDADEEASQRNYALMGDDRRFGRLKALVVYGTALFQAWFKLERTGELVMVDDASLANDLPLNVERFGDPRSPILAWPTTGVADQTTDQQAKDTAQVAIVHSYGHRFPADRAPRALSAGTLIEELQAGGSSGGEVTEPLRITLDGRMHGGSRKIVVTDTHFTRTVDLTGLGAGISLHFKNCLFEQGIQGHLAEIGGDLILENCGVGTLPDPRGSYYSMDLSDARIRGTLHLLDCHLEQSFLADRIQVEGDLLIWGCFLGGRLYEREPHWLAQELHELDIAMLSNGKALEPPPDRVKELNDATGVYLSNAVIHGDLELTVMDGSQRHRESKDQRNLTWSSAMACTVAHGGLRADGCVVHHSLALGGSIWGGDVELSNIHCHGNLIGFHLARDQATNKYRIVGLRVWNSSLNLANARIDADLSLSCADVLADHELRATGCGSLVLRSTTIGGCMNLMGARIASDLNFDFSAIGDYVNAYHSLTWDFEPRSALHVGNELSMSGANMGNLEFRGVRVGQRVRALTGTFGRMLISTGVMSYGKDNTVMPVVSQIGALEFSSVTFTGELQLTGIRISSEDRPLGPFRRAQANCGLKITGCSIGGDLLFFQEDLKVKLERRWSPTLEKRLSWADTENPNTERSSGDEGPARGVTNEPLNTSALQARTWGHLDLNGTTVGGHLDLRNTSVEGEFRLNDLYVKLDLRLDHGHDWKEKGLDDWNEPPRSTGSSMTAEKLRCDGDVRMTGLTLGVKDQQPDKIVLKAREAQVRGEWLFMPLNPGAQPRPRKQDKTTIALLHGGLDLAAAQINHLILGKENFQLSAKGGPDEQGNKPKVVDLERATINRFEIVKPMPSTVDLSRIKVGRWEFNAGTATADDYLDVLKEMNPFDRSVWVDVERSLRNEAREDDALKVYRGMRDAAQRRGLSTFRVFSRMEQWVTAYGTQVWRPMILWFIFLGFSLWLLSDPANVELELGPRVVLVQDGRIVSSDPLHGIALSSEEQPEGSTQAPSPYPALLQLRRDQLAAGSSWSLSDALFLTLRYHIPVLDMGIQSEWKAGQREFALGPIPLTPEKWAAFAQGYSFIAWSLLLIGLSVKVFRGKQG